LIASRVRARSTYFFVSEARGILRVVRLRVNRMRPVDYFGKVENVN